jgi:hypothetical protein
LGAIAKKIWFRKTTNSTWREKTLKEVVLRGSRIP